jgi:hypothetical protein
VSISPAVTEVFDPRVAATASGVSCALRTREFWRWWSVAGSNARALPWSAAAAAGCNAMASGPVVPQIFGVAAELANALWA